MAVRALIIALAVLLVAPTALAYPDPDRVPRYYPSDCFAQFDKRFLHDFIGLYDETYGSEIEGAACEVYAKTSAHFVFITVPDTEGESLENYAFHLFEEWGIGDEDREDGLMLLFVNDYLSSGESAARIEVGYGLEGVVNSRVSNDAWDLMVDTRDRAMASGYTDREARALALATGALYLMQTLVDGYTEAGFPEPSPAYDGPPWWFWLIVILIVLIVLAALSSSSRGRGGWGYHPGTTSWSGRGASGWTPGRSGGFGGYGGGGFGGGGSFGGGRSGGGGRGGRF